MSSHTTAYSDLKAASAQQFEQQFELGYMAGTLLALLQESSNATWQFSMSDLHWTFFDSVSAIKNHARL